MCAVLLTVLSGETTWMLSVFSCETSFPMPLGQWLVGVVHIFIEVASHVVAYDHCGDPMQSLFMSTTFNCPFVGLPHLATCAGCFAIVLDVGAAFHVHKVQLSFRRVATPCDMCRLLCHCTRGGGASKSLLFLASLTLHRCDSALLEHTRLLFGFRLHLCLRNVAGCVG